MNNCLLNLLFLTFFSITSWGNQGKLDSLLTRLAEVDDQNSTEILDLKSILCNDIAVCYQGIGENQKARFYFLQSIYFTETRVKKEDNWDAQNTYDLAYLYQNIAIFESANGKHEQARKYLGISEGYYKKLKPLIEIEEYNGLLRGVYHSSFTQLYHSSNYELAEKSIKNVLKISESLDLSCYHRAEDNRLYGELLCAQEKYSEGLAYYFKALAILNDTACAVAYDQNLVLHSIVVAYYHSEQYHKLIDFIQKQPNYSSMDDAQIYLDSAETVGKSSLLNNVFILSYAQFNLYKETGELHYLEAANAWQKFAFLKAEELTLTNRTGLLGSLLNNPKNKLLGIILSTMARQKEKLLSVMELVEVLRIIDVYHAAKLHLERTSFDQQADLWKREKELKNEMNYLILKLDELALENKEGNERDSLRERSYEITTELREIEGRTKKEKILEEYRVGQEEFGEKIKMYTAENNRNILTYFYEDEVDSLYILGVNADTCFLIPSRVDSNFTDQIATLYQLNAHLQTDPQKIDLQQTMNRVFYDIAFQPALPYLNGNDILIYPIGELSYLSFDALLNENNEYLVHDYSFHYTTSLYSVVAENQPSSKSAGVTAFYPSDYGTDSLAFLFNAGAEVNQIQSVLNGKTFAKNQATKQRFLTTAQTSKIVHLASHSILNFNRPYESYVIFDDSVDSVENRLFAYEIFSQTLNSDLVVLSSCNSAKGKLQEGIGVVSLSNAFYFAGVPSTVSSLWSAQDKSSSEIMIDFYRKLNAGLTKSAALREAKLSYLNQADKIKQQPFFWANYVVYGSDEALFEKKTTTPWYSYLIGVVCIGLLGWVGSRYFKSLNNSRASKI